YVIEDRKQLIYDYLVTRPKGQTRSQIETGAGYRREDVRIPKEEYEKLVRRIQRDLQEMVKGGEIYIDKRPNPRHRKGQNDDVVLYFANVPEGTTPETDNFTPQVRKHLYRALEAFDNKDADAVAQHLLAVLAGVAPNYCAQVPNLSNTPAGVA